MKTSLTKKITTLFGILFVAALCAVVYWNMHIWESARAVQIKRASLVTENASVTFLRDTEKQVEDIKRVAAAFDSYLIDKEKIVDFIKTCEMIAKNAGVQITIESVDLKEGGFSGSDGLLYRSLNMSLQVSGTWDQVNLFLQKFEKIPHHIGVNFMRLYQIGSNDDENTTVSWIADMSITGITN